MRQQPSFLNAIKWSYISVWGEKVFSVLFNFALVALLGPRDFGLVVIAWIYVTFVQLFLDQGLVCALIQKKDLDREHIDSVFWMDFFLSFFLVGLSILGGRWFAHANNAPEVATLIDVLSITIPIEALSVVPRALIQREMDFKSLSVRANACALLSGAIAVVLAYNGFGTWALVCQQIVASVTGCVLLWALCSWRPQLRFSWPHLRSLLGFSGSNFLVQLGLSVESQSSSVLIGIFFGPEAVGLYRFADRIMSTVTGTMTSSVQVVSLPEFSRLQDKPEELRKSVLGCIRLSSVLTLPALAGLAVVAGPLMATIGPRWLPAADVLSILCTSGTVLVLTFFTAPFLQATARPHQLALIEWARTVLGMILLLISCFAVRHSSLQWQLMGIALSRFALATFFVTPVFLYILMKLSRIPVHSFALAVLPAVAASISAVASVLFFSASGLLAGSKPFVLLLGEIAVGAIAGFAVLLFLDVHVRNAVLWLYRTTLGRQPITDIL